MIEIEVDLEAIAGRQDERPLHAIVAGQGSGESAAGVTEALDLFQGCIVMTCTDEHQDHAAHPTHLRRFGERPGCNFSCVG